MANRNDVNHTVMTAEFRNFYLNGHHYEQQQT
ncbi:hypothetical protein M2354_000703 [Leclercia adecarboxylata]|jgi:hypothetical protein|nr:hypothetical protein [Leclercia adecarboxylata]